MLNILGGPKGHIVGALKAQIGAAPFGIDMERMLLPLSQQRAESMC